VAINVNRFIQYELEKAKEALGSVDTETIADHIGLFFIQMINLRRVVLKLVNQGMEQRACAMLLWSFL
jgi:hypothetical protein